MTPATRLKLRVTPPKVCQLLLFQWRHCWRRQEDLASWRAYGDSKGVCWPDEMCAGNYCFCIGCCCQFFPLYKLNDLLALVAHQGRCLAPGWCSQCPLAHVCLLAICRYPIAINLFACSGNILIKVFVLFHWPRGELQLPVVWWCGSSWSLTRAALAPPSLLVISILVVLQISYLPAAIYGITNDLTWHLLYVLPLSDDSKTNDSFQSILAELGTLLDNILAL